MPQRERDVAAAKKLLAEAGVQPGLKVNLTTEQYLEIPQYAVLIQNFAREIGIDVNIKVESQDAYYGQGGVRPVGLARQRDGHHRITATAACPTCSYAPRC